MSLSSKKSENCYNRAHQKIKKGEVVDAHFSYDPYEWVENECDQHTCAYCNPPVYQAYHNKLVWVLTKLKVLTPAKAENLYYY